MRKVLLASAAFVALNVGGNAVYAADMALKAPPPAPVYSWTGFYIGGNVGYGMGMDSGTSSTTAGVADIIVAPGTVLYGGGQTFDLSGKGWNGGGQFGYNWQLVPSWVLGFETDIQGSSISGTSNCLMACNTPTAINFSAGAVTFPVMFASNSASFNLDWFGTVRGRFGYTSGPALFYITGGLAYGEVKTSAAVAGRTIFAGTGTTVNTFGGSINDSSVRTGWTFGAGIEAKLFGNWTAKAEYLYMDFGANADNYNTVFTSSLFGQTGFTAGNRMLTNDITEQVFRLGVNYKFSGPVSY